MREDFSSAATWLMFGKSSVLRVRKNAVPSTVFVVQPSTTLHKLRIDVSAQFRSIDDHKPSLNVAVQASAKGPHLVRHVSPDQRFFQMGDLALELLDRLSLQKAEHFLYNRGARGSTGIMVTLQAKHGISSLYRHPLLTTRTPTPRY